MIIMKTNTLNTILETFQTKFTVKKIDMGSLSKVKVGPMKFDIECYDIENIGRLSFMKGKAMLGLMKMDTVMLTTFNKDFPLISYDRINVMKNDTFIIEIYDTCDKLPDLSCFDSYKERLTSIPKYELKPAWYDSIRVTQSIAVKDKGQTELFNSVLSDYLDSIASLLDSLEEVDVKSKKTLQRKYVDGLLEHGGSSTDMFVKALGKEFTEMLYQEYLFGTK